MSLGSAASAVRAESVGKTYSTRTGTVEALRDVSVAVERGEFVSLVGASGCGKSTMLKIVAGLVPFETGAVEVLGRPASAGRREVGLMMQSAVLLPWRTVLANVLLPIEVHGEDGKRATSRAREILDMTGLRGFEDKYPWELSGGMQQRVSLSRLLVMEPELLLMDEPFAALDEFTRERLNLEIAGIHERIGSSTLYVTHNIPEAVFLSDRVVVMTSRPGRILDVVTVPLPRPRSAAMLVSHEVTSVVQEIRTLLGTGATMQEVT